MQLQPMTQLGSSYGFAYITMTQGLSHISFICFYTDQPINQTLKPLCHNTFETFAL